MKSKGEEVDYKTFVAMIEEGSVESVLVEDSRIEFTALNDEGEEAVFITGRMEDPALTERLLATNAKFTQEIIPEESPLLNFFLIWILPMVLGVSLLLDIGIRIHGDVRRGGRRQGTGSV
jgi:cell division protease FtsH